MDWIRIENFQLQLTIFCSITSSITNITQLKKKTKNLPKSNTITNRNDSFRKAEQRLWNGEYFNFQNTMWQILWTWKEKNEKWTLHLPHPINDNFPLKLCVKILSHISAVSTGYKGKRYTQGEGQPFFYWTDLAIPTSLWGHKLSLYPSLTSPVVPGEFWCDYTRQGCRASSRNRARF